MRNLSELKLEIPSIDPIESRSILGGGDYTASSPISTSDDKPYELPEAVVAVPAHPLEPLPENPDLQDDGDMGFWDDTEAPDNVVPWDTVSPLNIKGSEDDIAKINYIFSLFSHAEQVAISNLAGLQIIINSELVGKDGQYNPETGVVTLKSTDNQAALTEELMHAFQDGSGFHQAPGDGLQPGHSNLEFEAKVAGEFFGIQHENELSMQGGLVSMAAEDYIREVLESPFPINITDFTEQMDDYYNAFREDYAGTPGYSQYDDPDWEWHWAEYLEAAGVQYYRP